MNLSKLGKTIARFAPLLGAALPLPGGAALGQLIADAFGGNINDPKDLINRIKNDSDAAIKIKEIEANERIEAERIIAQDKQNARTREVDYIKATGEKDYTLKNLAYITTAGFFLVLLLLFIPGIDVNEQEKNLILVLLGMLASKWQTIIDYFFGSSNSKRDNF